MVKTPRILFIITERGAWGQYQLPPGLALFASFQDAYRTSQYYYDTVIGLIQLPESEQLAMSYNKASRVNVFFSDSSLDVVVQPCLVDE